MRVDKFLKVSRLIKRRTVAKDVSDQGRVWINGRDAKASSTVKPGDELKIQFGQKIVTIRVEQIVETTRKEEAANMYTLVKEESLKAE
jgi:ribosomal 50S subunit-recycling heat shock protein